MEENNFNNKDKPTEMQELEKSKASGADDMQKGQTLMPPPPRKGMPPPPPRFDAAKASSEEKSGLETPEAHLAAPAGPQATLKANGQPFRPPPPRIPSKGPASGSTKQPSNSHVPEESAAMKPRSSDGALPHCTSLLPSDK
jgi:hypothetical protein